MRHYIFTLFILLLSAGVYAQVGVGIPVPDPSAMLDVTSTDQGFFAPATYD